MTTWLDVQAPLSVRRALGVANDSDDAAGRFDLWLSLVDLHLAELRSRRSGLVWDWHRRYQDGWSPRTAAFAAWANNVHPMALAGEPL
jgi:hypothetical protein